MIALLAGLAAMAAAVIFGLWRWGGLLCGHLVGAAAAACAIAWTPLGGAWRAPALLGLMILGFAPWWWVYARRLGQRPVRTWLAVTGAGALLLIGSGHLIEVPTRAWITLGVGAVLAPVMVKPGRGPVPDLLALSNTVLGYGTFGLACALAAVQAPLLAFLPRSTRTVLALWGARFCMRGVFLCTPTVCFRPEGASDLAGDRVLVANHEGMLDILAVLALPGRRGILAKGWVFRTPVLGWGAWGLGARNGDDLEADDFGSEAGERLLAGLPGLSVFAENSRARDGRVHRFRSGAFRLAMALGVPVRPVALAGSFQGITPGEVWIHPSIVRARVLPPMTALPDEAPIAFARRCRDAIAAARLDLCRSLLASWLLRHRRQIGRAHV